jgi:hypothetical protein
LKNLSEHNLNNKQLNKTLKEKERTYVDNKKQEEDEIEKEKKIDHIHRAKEFT